MWTQNFQVPRWLRLVLVCIAIALFGGGLYWAINDIQIGLKDISFLLLGISFLLCLPITTLLNAIELKYTMRRLDADISTRDAASIIIVGTAVNLAPIPAGAAARLGFMKARGISLARGSGSILLISGLWLGFSLLVAACLLLTLGKSDIAILAAAIGLVITAPCWLLLQRLLKSTKIVLAISCLRILMILNDILRIYLVFLALDQLYSISQIAIVVVSNPVGSAASFIPAGLGVREFSAALLAPLTSVDAALAFLVTSLNRLLDMIFFVPPAIWLFAKWRRAKEVKAAGS